MQTFLAIIVKMMAVKVLALCTSLLLIFLLKVEVTGLQRLRRMGKSYTCSYYDEPKNCMNITITSITKSVDYYYINVPAKSTGGIRLVVCAYICYYCGGLLGKGENIKQVNCTCTYNNNN